MTSNRKIVLAWLDLLSRKESINKQQDMCVCVLISIFVRIYFDRLSLLPLSLALWTSTTINIRTYLRYVCNKFAKHENVYKNRFRYFIFCVFLFQFSKWFSFRMHHQYSCLRKSVGIKSINAKIFRSFPDIWMFDLRRRKKINE